MGVAKVTLNGTTLIDTTQKTVDAGSMLSAKTALNKAGENVTGTIVTKTSSDLTASGSTVTVPAGYYSAQATKNVSAGTATTPAKTITTNPTVTIASSTGIVTAAYTGSSSITPTVTAGYITTGTAGTVSTTGTNTLQLTSKAAATINTSTADQTIASYRWLTGTQTIKSVTTANISAANIVSGVTVKVGDANNASRILQVTGTAPTGTVQTAFAPAVTLASSTGVITGTNTFAAGVYAASTKTSTLNLTTQAASTWTPGTANQTISSYRWLTGAQTIKGDANLTAANIAEGVSIFGVTGTHSGATSYTATITGTGNSTYCYVTYAGTKKYTAGTAFTFKAGDSITIYCQGDNVKINGTAVTLSSHSYTYTLPVGDITIDFYYYSATDNNINVYTMVQPTGTLTISAGGKHDVYKYSAASVATGTAFAPAITLASSTGVITGTNTFGAGYYSASTTTSTINLTTQAASTWTPGTANRTISSYRWLTGSQIIAGDGNLLASNIRSGTSIFGVTGILKRYESWMMSLIYNSYIGSEDPDFLDFVGNLSEVSQFMFAAKRLPSSVTFSNVSRIMNQAFICINDPTDLGLNHVYFPSCTSIAYYAFQNRANMQTVSFPECVTLRSYAFSGCNRLESAYFPKCSQIEGSVFATCTSLSVASFPVCTSIGNYAFYWCQYLSTVSFPICTTISNSAFLSCSRITGVYFPSCTLIGSSAFMSCYSMSTASFPVCTMISNGAFTRCSSLTTISFPECVTVGDHAFASCFALPVASFPKCVTISSYAFYTCWSLTEARFPKCTSLGPSAFGGCSLLQTVSFPILSIIGDYAFSGCSSLSTISFSECESIGAGAFLLCKGLNSVSLPKVKSIGSSAFASCSSLTTLSFPNCSEIYNYAFGSCSNLTSLYLLGSSVVALKAITAFYYTPISNSTYLGYWGSIYVPSSLYDSYKTATNWATYSSRLVSM